MPYGLRPWIDAAVLKLTSPAPGRVPSDRNARDVFRLDRIRDLRTQTRLCYDRTISAVHRGDASAARAWARKAARYALLLDKLSRMERPYHAACDCQEA